MITSVIEDQFIPLVIWEPWHIEATTIEVGIRSRVGDLQVKWV